MWKDFFYFSSAQRRGVIVLTVLIILVVAINFTLPLFFPVTDSIDDANFSEEVEEFKKTLLSRDSLKRVEQERLQEEKEARYNRFNKKEQQDYLLFHFDPNTADSITFVKLGLRSSTAGNIIKYRKNGGVFKTPDDFRKIYGISENKFNELKPFISIGKKNERRKEKIVPEKIVEVETLVVELNSADTLDLMKIRGVGRYYAKEIIKYRKQLGGYVSVNQLLEIKSMRPETFEKIAPFCAVDVNKIDKLDINTATVDYMNRHPYINFYQAKAIYELRRIKGKLNSVDELMKLTDFSEEDLVKLKPYLIFK